MKWNIDQITFLVKHYPKQGRDWCAQSMGLTAGQIRSKASRLKLKARGISEAWKKKQRDHSARLLGKPMTVQNLAWKKMSADGLIPKKTKEQKEAVGIRMKNWIATNGHPRGYLGMKHTPEALKKISLTSILQNAARTDEMKVQINIKSAKTKMERGTYAPPRQKTTWKAAWREIGGFRKYYRSRWEANYAYYLEWLKTEGHIADWRHEPKCFWFEGVKRGTVSYLPDFLVIENDGSEAFHEVKGWMDERSKTKIKRMAKYHPKVKLIVIDSKGYAALKKSISSLVPGWEE